MEVRSWILWQADIHRDRSKDTSSRKKFPFRTPTLIQAHEQPVVLVAHALVALAGQIF
jgi:hypothetical protein